MSTVEERAEERARLRARHGRAQVVPARAALRLMRCAGVDTGDLTAEAGAQAAVYRDEAAADAYDHANQRTYHHPPAVHLPIRRGVLAVTDLRPAIARARTRALRAGLS